MDLLLLTIPAGVLALVEPHPAEQWVSRVTIAGLLAFALYTGRRRWWVFGWQYDALDAAWKDRYAELKDAYNSLSRRHDGTVKQRDHLLRIATSTATGLERTTMFLEDVIPEAGGREGG